MGKCSDPSTFFSELEKFGVSKVDGWHCYLQSARNWGKLCVIYGEGGMFACKHFLGKDSDT